MSVGLSHLSSSTQARVLPHMSPLLLSASSCSRGVPVTVACFGGSCSGASDTV